MQGVVPFPSQEVTFDSDQNQGHFIIKNFTPLEELECGSAFRPSSLSQNNQLLREWITPQNNKNNQKKTKSTPSPLLQDYSQSLQIFYEDQSIKPEPANTSPYSEQRKQMGLGKKEVGEKEGVSEEWEGSGQKMEGRDRSKGKVNDYKTKNMLQFFWKVVKNHLRGQELMTAQIQKLGPSLKTFQYVFRMKELRGCLRQLFKSRCLEREVAGSGVQLSLKRVYLRKVSVLRRGFIERELHFLN